MNILLVVTAVLCGILLLSKKIRNNRMWRATVTPLASIIGSGFLVIVPLLGNAVGGYAPLAMLIVVVFAHMIGSAMRFNIKHIEPILIETKKRTVLLRFEQVSALILGMAYFISVTFYLRLLSSFALQAFSIESDLIARILTSSILIFIGVSGWIRGLSFLERLEEYSVSIKLANCCSNVGMGRL